MRIINKKYLLIILLVGVLLTGVIVLKPKEESKLYEVKLQNDNKKDLAIMVEQLDKSYKEINKIPYKGYTLNKDKTKCIDNNGDEVDEEIAYENGTITISTDRTIYCYLYFDRKEEIEDLSGKENHGKNHAVEWTEEGITTSNKDEKGYVDCGLAGYDFKDSITMITRVKFNDLESDQQFLGNWEVAGGGLTFYTSFLQFVVYIDDGYKVVDGTCNFSLDMYYIVVSVYDGEEVSIYIDGQKVISQKLSGNIKPSNMPILLGGNPSFGEKPSGFSYTTFTDALFFDSALSETEIREYFGETIDKEKVLSKYANTGSEQKLLLYYKFD